MNASKPDLDRLLADAQRHVEADELDAAAEALTKAARSSLRAGHGVSALTIADRGLALAIEGEWRTTLMIVRARVLDHLDDPNAAFAWSDIGMRALETPLGEICIAHATGALIKHQGSDPLDTARILLSSTRYASPAHRVELLGAMGESAGAVGVPYLIQAVTTMRFPTAFTQTTIAYWELLLAKLRLPPALTSKLASFVGHAPTQPDLQLGLCGLGLAFGAAGDDTSVRDRVLIAIERYASEQRTTLQDMLERAQLYVTSHDVFAELRRLAEVRGAEHWLLP